MEQNNLGMTFSYPLLTGASAEVQG